MERGSLYTSRDANRPAVSSVRPSASAAGTSAPPEELAHSRGHNRARKLTPKIPRSLMITGLVVIVAIVAAAVWFLRQGGSFIEGDKYQALILSNGEVYFGKLHDGGAEYMTLEDVYYIQPSKEGGAKTETVQGAEAAALTQLQLIKLGNEVHGPTDRMVIRKDQILYFENLKPDGQVAKLIDQDKN